MHGDDGFLYYQNYDFIRLQLERYKADPNSVDGGWRKFFESMDSELSTDLSNEDVCHIFSSVSHSCSKSSTHSASSGDAIDRIVDEYRRFGSLAARLDPLGISDLPTSHFKVLSPSSYDLDLSDASVQGAVSKMQRLYCGTRSMEAMHISDLDERNWLLNKFENLPQCITDKETQDFIYRTMLESELFEQFLHVKFAGAKRFSIEGGESSMVVFEALVETLAAEGVEEIVMGMPHRGRLNCLVKVVGKPYSYIMSEFMDNPVMPSAVGLSGDVKYHLGASVERELRNGCKVTISLTPNPSHLEAVNTVATGRTKAKQVLRNEDVNKVATILSHGDSSFSGQGIVYESLQLDGVDGYSTGGVIHIIVNNQIGFTTEPSNYSSTRHTTEIAKFIGAPIFHVNGDDPESAYLISKLAAEYRMAFHKDVVINVVCYRKYGHNEGDEPMFTQPTLYKKISSRPSPVEMYAKDLLNREIMTREQAEGLSKNFRDFLASELTVEKSKDNEKLDWLTKNWHGLRYSSELFVEGMTGITKEHIDKVVRDLFVFPENFSMNPKVAKLVETRKNAMTGKDNLDWGTAEWLAFGSFLVDGKSVRVSGQDSMRGTFSHRHAVMFDYENKSPHHLFAGLARRYGSRFDVFSSPLSEYGVLGFEYGYSNVTPHTLVVWEAQYGDFANGAQIIFDQFISSAELKWLRMSGLVVLLPHAYEGQGPEHSSARIERYLQICAENNMRVINCTTPANYFHALRRQLVLDIRKPLVVFSPKSLLRHKDAVSSLDDFLLNKSFQYVVGDTHAKTTEVERVVFCSGKVYYDLNTLRIKNNVNKVAIVRIEQLYPLNTEHMKRELAKYSKIREIVWCQEEPKNMGAWQHVFPYLLDITNAAGITLQYIGRKESAATAVGYHSIHAQQQNKLLEEALTI